MIDELLNLASRQLDRIKVAVSQADLKYVELAPTPFGLGIGIAWGPTDYVVLSVMGGGSENQLLITCGVLRDVQQDRLAVLDACNKRNQDCSAYPFFLHDAEVGWDILVQHTYPIELMLDVPPFFVGAVRNLPQVAATARQTFATDWSIGGQPYQWNDEDVQRLLIRSMI